MPNWVTDEGIDLFGKVRCPMCTSMVDGKDGIPDKHYLINSVGDSVLCKFFSIVRDDE